MVSRWKLIGSSSSNKHLIYGLSNFKKSYLLLRSMYSGSLFFLLPRPSEVIALKLRPDLDAGEEHPTQRQPELGRCH